jgi:hypothetical protein
VTIKKIHRRARRERREKTENGVSLRSLIGASARIGEFHENSRHSQDHKDMAGSGYGFALVLLAGVAGADAILDEQLIQAAERGDLDLVNSLLDMGADVNGRVRGGTMPLMIAAFRGRLNMVKLLLDKGAEVNAKEKGGWTALMGAISKGHLDVVRLLVDRGADIDARPLKNMTALTMAHKKGHKEIAE